MQINPINYLHYASKFCAGYENYLGKRKLGNIIVFNWSYFFLSFTWLIYHRMYKEFIFFTYYFFIFSFLFQKNIITANIAGLVIVTSHVLISFFTYRLYENHLDMNVKLNSPDVFKRIRPFNFLASIFLTILSIIVTMVLYEIIIVNILKLFYFL